MLHISTEIQTAQNEQKQTGLHCLNSDWSQNKPNSTQKKHQSGGKEMTARSCVAKTQKQSHCQYKETWTQKVFNNEQWFNILTFLFWP